MAKTFRPYDPEQLFLLPPAIQEWIPENHLARYVSDVIDELDLSAIEKTYDVDRGFPPFHPRMMTKVLVYAYCTGVYSSRRIAAKLTDSVAFRFLAAGNDPDFRTISEFRNRHGKAFAGLFEQILALCRQAGLVKLGRVAVDGTRIKANASKHKAMSYGRMKQKETQLRQRVKDLMRQAEETDAQEDRTHGRDVRGDELPQELATQQSRLKKIREAKAALEEEARRKAKDAGKDPDDSGPADKDQRNFTDPESKIQKTSDGFIQGYNAQAAVDGEFQIIVAQLVTEKSTDVNQLLPVVDEIERVLEEKPAVVLADAGYWSESNVSQMESRGIEPVIATRRVKHGERPEGPRGRAPSEMTARERMDRKLATKTGREDYSKRKTIVEPVFGHIKQARGFRQFLMRGVKKVGQEWALLSAVHNLLKLCTARGMA